MSPLLTPRQARFVDEYLTDFNASAALARAGYSGKTQTTQVLASPRVQAALLQRWEAEVADKGALGAFPALPPGGEAPDFLGLRLAGAGKPLTGRQLRFVEEYVIDQNARAAAERAGYSPANSTQYGHRLKRLPHVAAAVAARLKALSARCGLNAERVLMEAAKGAFADLREMIGEDGRPRAVEVLPEGLAMTVEVHWKGEQEQRVWRPAAKAKYLDFVGKAVGVFGRHGRGRTAEGGDDQHSPARLPGGATPGSGPGQALPTGDRCGTEAVGPGGVAFRAERREGRPFWPPGSDFQAVGAVLGQTPGVVRPC